MKIGRMRARPSALRRTLSFPLLLASLTIGVARAHDIEVEGAPEDLPGSEHVACEQGLAAGFPCWNVELVEFVPVTEFGGQQTNDIWGWTDPLTGGEYVMIGVRHGTAFFALDDHGHPTLRGTLPTRTNLSAWRDIKVYGNHAFIVSEAAGHGMQVFDLRRLREASDGPMSFTSDADYSGFGNAHNIAINEETAFAYAVGTRTCSGGLHMIDIRDPLAPVFAGCFSRDGYTHDAQCVVYHGPDADFVGREICFNANEDTVTIVDVSNKAAPLMLARAPYFSSRYTHQGWLSEDTATSSSTTSSTSATSARSREPSCGT
jgi:choice-of-anchor B domain-containing protein